MSQSVVHSRQQSKNSKQIHTLRKDSSRGDYDINDICQSPQNKYNSLIKRFNKKPENIENAHLKYLQNGIKDISMRNIHFQLKNSESSSSLIQQQERSNAHKRLTDPFSQHENIDHPKSIKEQERYGNISNNVQSNTNKNNIKQGSVKPIRTICLNLYDQKDESELQVKRTTRNDSKQISEHPSNNFELYHHQNKSTSNGIAQNNVHQINLGKIQPGVTSSSTLSNSTRFSPRYSQHGLNIYTQNSQQSIKGFSKDQQDSCQTIVNILGNPESSESDLNQNDSTITTPTKYQQYAHYPQQFEVKYNIPTNSSQNSKMKQKNSINSSQQSSSAKTNQMSTTPKMVKINQTQDKSHNQSQLKDLQYLQYPNDSPNHHSTYTSKVNLNHLLKNAGGKQYYTPNNFSLLSSKDHSRKCSSQFATNELNKILGGDQNFQDVILGDNKFNNNQCKNSRQNSLGKYTPSNNSFQPQQNVCSSQQNAAQSTLNTSNRSQSNLNPNMLKRLPKDPMKSPSSNTPLQSKKSSAHFQSEEIQAISRSNQRNNSYVSQNFNSSKILPQTNAQSNKLINLKSNESIGFPNQLSLVQSCNIKAQQQISISMAQQNPENVKQGGKERDRSQTYSVDNHFRQRSTSKGNIKAINNKSSLQTTQPKQIQGQAKTINQSSSQINLSTLNASSSIMPSQNSAFNFQPSFFTPIDNESLYGYLQKQTSRNNSQVRENPTNPQTQLAKQRSCTQLELQTITSFVELEQQIEINNQQQQQFELSKKQKLFS